MSSGNWRTPFVILLCGTTVMLIAFGIRMTYGLWISPASAGLGWGLESLSFAMAAQALIWGSRRRSWARSRTATGPGG